jgi:hypothetical protein
MERIELIANIIGKEVVMFADARNIGGPAPCQLDLDAFRRVRESQMNSWDDDVLESYLDDLFQAEKAGRNIVAEKYGYMMEKTSIVEFEKIRVQLPIVTENKKRMIDEIVVIHRMWIEELAAKYPRVLRYGRPLTSKEDLPGAPSMETYLRGELTSYSEATIEKYFEMTKKFAVNGTNPIEIDILEQVRAQGYASIEKAEEKIKSQ